MLALRNCYSRTCLVGITKSKATDSAYVMGQLPMNRTIRKWEREGLKVAITYTTLLGWGVRVEKWADVGPCYKSVFVCQKKWVLTGQKTLEKAIARIVEMMQDKDN